MYQRVRTFYPIGPPLAREIVSELRQRSLTPASSAHTAPRADTQSYLD